MRPLDFPNNIQIQTTAFCNASCSFCPYPETSRTLPMGTMDDDLFHAIVDQLAGRDVLLLQPFLMNEPLMDKQIVPRLAYMKAKVPGATDQHHDQRRAPAAGPRRGAGAARPGQHPRQLERAHVRRPIGPRWDIDGAEVLANVNHLADALRAAGARTRLIVTALLLKQNREEVFLARDYWRARGVEFFLNPLNDRAGNIGDGALRDMLPFDEDVNRAQLLHYDMSGCPALYAFLGILYNGDLVTCCMDWRRSLVLGNAREHSLPRALARPRLRRDPGAERHRAAGRARAVPEMRREPFQHRPGQPRRPRWRSDGTSAGAPPRRTRKIARHLRQILAAQPDDLKLNLLRPGRRSGMSVADEARSAPSTTAGEPRMAHAARPAREHAVRVDLDGRRSGSAS